MSTKDTNPLENKTINEYSSKALKNEYHGLDALVKFIIVIAFSVVPFYIEKQLNLVVLILYLLIAALATKIKLRTLLLSAASYFIIVLFPFLFGYFTTEVIYYFSGNEMFSYSQSGYEVFLRLFRLFIIWFVSILYFHTTPTETVIGLFDKLLAPLKLIKVPIQDYLKVIMCIVIDLKGKGAELRDSFMKNAREALGGDDNVEKLKLRDKIKGISRIIVSLLVDSFEKINEVQKIVDNLDSEELYNYKLKIGIREILVVFIFIILIVALFILEHRVL